MQISVNYDLRYVYGPNFIEVCAAHNGNIFLGHT